MSGYVVRFSMKRHWHEMATIDTRCENARLAGVITSVDRHHDAVSNTVIYEIRYPEEGDGS